MSMSADNNSPVDEPKPGNQAEAPDPLVGRILNGKYRVIEKLAHGGMSCIYTAEQTPLNRTVAIKVLLPHLIIAKSANQEASTSAASGTSEFSRRFIREASMLAKLQHPNIVTVFDYGTIDQELGSTEAPQYYMVMEYLQGNNLARHLQLKGRLAYQETVSILKQVVQGLRVAHQAGVVHRDLKPANLMLLPNGDSEEIVKILDFGILKILGQDKQEQELTQAGVFIGSPKYMAPEQGMGIAVDERSDIYSLGVIAYHMIAGVVPFVADTSLQTMVAHVNNKPRPLSELVPEGECPLWLEDLVMRCLAKTPDLRPQSCDVLARELRAAGSVVPFSDTERSAPRPLLNQAAMHLDVETVASSDLSDSLHQIVTQGTLAGGVASANAANRRSISIVVVLGILIAGSLGAYILKAPAANHSSPSVSSSASSQAAPTPDAQAEVQVYRLKITSVPPGARIYDGDAMLGITPTQVSIDNRSLRAAPRPLLLRLDGFEAFRVDPGVSNNDLETEIALVPTTKAAGAANATGHVNKPRPGQTDGKDFDPPTKPVRPLDDNPWEKKK